MTVDCSEVLRQLYQLLDGELSESRIRELESHINLCGSCLPRVNIEKLFKEMVKTRCREKAPEALKSAILSRLSEEPRET